MIDFKQEIKHLQKLSCISLSPEEEKKLWKQLINIIEFLWKLPESKGVSWDKKREGKLTLRTIKGIGEDSDTKKIFKNIQHPIVNNSIAIKSVLN